MRIANSLILAVCSCAVAMACGGSSEVTPARTPEDGGEGGEVNGKGGSGGKAGKGGSGGTNSAGKGGSAGGDAGGSGEGATSGSSGRGGSGGTSAGVGGDAGAPGTGGTSGASAEGGLGGEGGVNAGAGGASAGMGGEAGSWDGPGSLRVIVTPPGNSTGVSVEVNGPAGFAQTITRTRLFQEVPEGQYTFSATLAFVPGPIVSSLYEPLITPNPIAVVGGAQSNVLVTYPDRFGGSGRLWTADYGNGNIAAFDASRLGAGSTEVGDLRLTVAGDGRLSQLIAFDAEGNAWIGDCGAAGDIVKVGPDALSGTGEVTVTPDVVLGPPEEPWATCVVAIEFDRDGNLYAAHFAGHVLRYTADQLGASASPSAPAAILASANFGQIQDLEFDADGNLWVSAYGSNAVSKLAPGQLETSNETLVPTTTWSISEPEGIELGPDGNLWVATYNNHVRAYDPTTTSTTPTPLRDITLPAGFGPLHIAFDEGGNLWATSYNLGKVARFNAADLTTDGQKAAAYELDNPDFLSGWSLAFNPGP